MLQNIKMANSCKIQTARQLENINLPNDHPTIQGSPIDYHFPNPITNREYI